MEIVAVSKERLSLVADKDTFQSHPAPGFTQKYSQPQIYQKTFPAPDESGASEANTTSGTARLDEKPSLSMAGFPIPPDTRPAGCEAQFTDPDGNNFRDLRARASFFAVTIVVGFNDVLVFLWQWLWLWVLRLWCALG